MHQRQSLHASQAHPNGTALSPPPSASVPPAQAHSPRVCCEHKAWAVWEGLVKQHDTCRCTKSWGWLGLGRAREASRVLQLQEDVWSSTGTSRTAQHPALATTPCHTLPSKVCFGSNQRKPQANSSRVVDPKSKPLSALPLHRLASSSRVIPYAVDPNPSHSVPCPCTALQPQIWVGSKQRELQANSSQLLQAYTPHAIWLLAILIPIFEPIGG